MLIFKIVAQTEREICVEAIVCIYQHGVLPRLLWPLLVYDVPISTVEAMERALSGYIRRWL